MWTSWYGPGPLVSGIQFLRVPLPTFLHLDPPEQNASLSAPFAPLSLFPSRSLYVVRCWRRRSRWCRYCFRINFVISDHLPFSVGLTFVPLLLSEVSYNTPSQNRRSFEVHNLRAVNLKRTPSEGSGKWFSIDRKLMWRLDFDLISDDELGQMPKLGTELGRNAPRL